MEAWRANPDHARLPRGAELVTCVSAPHHRHPQLPADNNVAENVIKQLGKKLRLMEGFASLESAERFSRLLIACYRYKRFTDSRRNGGNGRSPLEHAGVSLPTQDWLDYLLTAAQQQQPI
jgi:hypothetical protein